MTDDRKYYKLEELKVGMRVSVASLLRIYDVFICLDADTLEHDDYEIAYGTIVYVGEGDFTKLGINNEDVYVINNVCEEESLEYYLEG